MEGENSLTDLNAPSADAPVMLPAHLDGWAQTAPEPRPSPDVAIFLHGPRESVPDVQVCWRADLDLATNEAQRNAIESLTLCPPSSTEMLPVPIGTFKRWLAGEETEDDSGDVEGETAGEKRGDTRSNRDDGNGSTRGARHIVRWRGAATSDTDVTSNPASIVPGDIVVIPTAHPGPWSQLGDLPPNASDLPATLDVGDAAHRVNRAKPLLRLHRVLVDAWPDSMTAKATAQSLLTDLRPAVRGRPGQPRRRGAQSPDGVVDNGCRPAGPLLLAAAGRAGTRTRILQHHHAPPRMPPHWRSQLDRRRTPASAGARATG